MTGRPIKRSADWFPHDGHASDRSKTLTVLESHYGAEGYMAWFKLLERLSTSRNHVIDCRNPEDTEFLAAKLKLLPDRFELILSKMAYLNAIDRDLWNVDRVIWCQNLVDNLKPVYDNRNQSPPSKPLPRARVEDIGALPHDPTVSRIETPISMVETPVSSPESTQREVVEVVERERPPISPLVTPGSGWLQTLQKFRRFEYQQGWPEDIERTFLGIDLEAAAKEFVDYWSERRTTLKSVKAAWRNRLAQLQRGRQSFGKGGTYGTTRRDKAIPGYESTGAFRGVADRDEDVL